MKKIFTILLIFSKITAMSQDSWLQENNFTAGDRYGTFSFNLGSKIYVGTGTTGTEPYKSDFWEYDPLYNTWTQKADFGGGMRVFAVGFSVGNKGYAGTGLSGYYGWTKDMWEYDPVSNTWIQRADFSGGLRASATAFTAGAKAYVGTGYYQLNPNVNAAYFNDMWEYDPPTDSWIRKADIPEEGRVNAGSMSIGNKGYIGFGDNNNILKNDFWEFDPSSDIWTKKADLPATKRSGPAMFSIGNKGYVVSGWAGYPLKDNWEFDPASNNWTRKTDLPAEGRSEGIGLAVGNKGYVGLGSGTQTYNDLWEYRTYPVTLSCPSDTTVSAAAGCTAVVNGIDPVFTPAGENTVLIGEIIYNGQMIYDHFGSVSGRAFNLGTSYVYYIAPDWSGYCGFTVTVVDDPPVLTCPNDVSFYKKESNMYSVAELVATDGCGIADIKYEITGATTRSGTGLNASGIFNLGVSTITWTVKDINNNTSTCTTNVTIIVETMPEITICNQTWMQKNLNVTKYRNGDPIPQVTDPTQWNSLTTGAWCYYNNDPSTEVTYGKIYNWYAVSDPRGLAPAGWHIPDNGEWITLEYCAGGNPSAGGALKETGTAHWTYPNTGATNSTGFTAFPGGMRTGGGSFLSLGHAGGWWSTNSFSYIHYGVLISGGFYRSILYSSPVFFGNPTYAGYPSYPIWEFKGGMSVRCVKDIPPSFTSCPSNQTLYSTPDSCNRVVTYNAVVTGNPAPAVSYSFTGATVGSGSGTGSGQLFNRGITTVTVMASTAMDTATCVFNVTVLDTIHPIITCPAAQTLCYQENNNYTIPLLTASDNCGIETINYVITGATARNGSGPDASGSFNTGTSTITWSVSDSSGNVSTCTSVISVSNRLTVSIPDTYPLLIGGTANALYIGYGPNCASLVAIPSGGTPFPGLNGYQYTWSNGSTSISSLACPPSIAGSYTYTVTVTDAEGCTATAMIMINVVDIRCGNNNDKVIICQVPPGNPGNRKTICVSKNAVAAHLKNGSLLGACAPSFRQKILPVVPIGKAQSLITESRMDIYPNPNKGSFTLQLRNVEAGLLTFQVADAGGRVVADKRIAATAGEQTIQVNLGALAKGVYWVKLTGRSNVLSSKLVIQ